MSAESGPRRAGNSRTNLTDIGHDAPIFGELAITFLRSVPPSSVSQSPDFCAEAASLRGAKQSLDRRVGALLTSAYFVLSMGGTGHQEY